MLITLVSEMPRRIRAGAVARGIAVINLVPELAATAGALLAACSPPSAHCAERYGSVSTSPCRVGLAVMVASLLSRADH